MKDIFSLLGNKIKLLLILSMPLGVIVGLIEILFAITLNDLLITSNLINGEIRFNFLDSIYLIFIVGLLRFFFVFLAQINTNYIFELVNKQVREITIDKNYTYKKEIGLIKSQKLLNVISTRVAEFLHSCSALSIQILVFLIIYLNLINQSFYLTLIVTIGFLILSTPLIFVKKKISIYSTSFQNSLNKVTEKIFKDIRNLNFLRIIGSLKREKDEIIIKNNRSLNSYKKYLISISFLNQIPQFIGILVIAIIIITNQKYFFIDQALIVPFLYLILRCIISFGNIINEYGRILFTKSFVKNLKHILENEKKEDEIINLNQKIINLDSLDLKVKNLSIGYDEIIKSKISFKSTKGSFNLFSGNSGTGKTALLMTLIGILKKKNGEIYWNESSINDINLNNFRNNISYCGTDPFLIEGSILDNLKYGLKNFEYNYENIKNVLEICDCDFLKINNVYNLNFHLDNEGSGLSSGQRQRISIARAIIKNPAILILDEATVNIDEKTEYKILKKIREKYKKCTIFAISHRKSLENFADQIIDLNN